MSGSKNPNIKMGSKTPTQIFSDVCREYPSFGWRMFHTRDEALTFIATGKDDWETLNTTPGSSAEVLKQAYLSLSKSNHPDKKGGDTVKFQQIVSAYRRLTN